MWSVKGASGWCVSAFGRAWPPALRAQASGGDTVLTGPFPDRASLHGVLAEIEAPGLELFDVR
jgi:hypothetical protein